MSTRARPNRFRPTTTAATAAAVAAALLVLAAASAACAWLGGDGGDAGPAAGVRQRWRQPQEGAADARPAVLGDAVVFATGDGYLVSRDRATGAARWATRVHDRPIAGANVVAGGGVVAVAADYHTAGVDAATGRLLWSYTAPADSVDRPDAAPGYVAAARLDADDSTVYVPAWGASVSAVDARTGAARWSWRTAPSVRHRSGSSGVRVAGDAVYATVWHFLNATGTESEAWVLALDRRTGRELWRVTLPTRSEGVMTSAQPAVWENLVIVNTVTGDVYALERGSGRVAWHVPQEQPDAGQLFNAVVTSPALRDGIVYADGGTGYLRAFRAADGTPVWRVRYGAQMTRDLLVTDRRIYGVSGLLHVFDRRSGSPLVQMEEPGVPVLQRLFSSAPAAAEPAGELFISMTGAAWSFQEP